MRTRAIALTMILASAVTGVSALPCSAGEPAKEAETDRERAASSKRRGDAAMDEHRFADALAAYVDAYALGKDPALLYKKGRALQGLGDFPAALVELESFDRVAPAELKQRVPVLARMIDDLRARVTTLSLTCEPANAEVKLGDRVLGRCPPPESLVVSAGRVSLEVTAEGYFPTTRDVDLPPGGRASLHVRLASGDSTGVVVVRSNVERSAVVIDGTGFGIAPVEASLGPGQHAIEVRRDGYRLARTSAPVAPGERREVVVPLEAEATILSRWWFWTGVAVVVAGGVVIGIASQVERSPPSGTIPPGTVQGGLSLSGLRF